MRLVAGQMTGQKRKDVFKVSEKRAILEKEEERRRKINSMRKWQKLDFHTFCLHDLNI